MAVAAAAIAAISWGLRLRLRSWGLQLLRGGSSSFVPLSSLSGLLALVAVTPALSPAVAVTPALVAATPALSLAAAAAAPALCRLRLAALLWAVGATAAASAPFPDAALHCLQEFRLLSEGSLIPQFSYPLVFMGCRFLAFEDDGPMLADLV